MDNRPEFFPRFRSVPPVTSSRYLRVTYTPKGYCCEEWEYKPVAADNSATQSRPEPLHASQRVSRRAELLVDLFFLISVGLFILTFLWAQGLLA